MGQDIQLSRPDRIASWTTKPYTGSEEKLNWVRMVRAARRNVGQKALLLVGSGARRRLVADLGLEKNGARFIKGRSLAQILAAVAL